MSYISIVKVGNDLMESENEDQLNIKNLRVNYPKLISHMETNGYSNEQEIKDPPSTLEDENDKNVSKKWKNIKKWASGILWC